MTNQEKKKLTYTKDMLVRNIAEECGNELKTVRSIYNSLEDNITALLSSANHDTDVMIRLFEGISINSTFMPEKIKVNNLTGEKITTTSKIRPKAHITRNYCEKLNNHNK